MLTSPVKMPGSRRLTLCMLILLALGLRLTRLLFQPLWWDEGWSLYFATSNIGKMLELTAIDIHPPFYYLLLHLWIGICGPSPTSIRLLSVLIGTATVPLLYVIGRQLLGDKGGLLAAFLLAVSPFHIYYSQEVRMYGLVTLLGLAASFFALQWKLGIGDWGRGTWLAYVLAATAALYTQYYAAFLLLALNLVVLIHWLRLPFLRGRGKREVGASPGGGRERRVREILPWLGAQIAVAILYMPWLWYASDKLLTYVRFKISVEKDRPLGFLTYLGHHLAAFNWGHAEGPLAGWWWLALLPLVALGLALISSLWRRSRKGELENLETEDRPLGIRHAALCIVTWALILACGFVVNLVFPFNPVRSERLLLLALPAYLLLVAAALLVLRRCYRPLATLSTLSLLVIGLWSLVFFYTVPRYPGNDYRPLAARVRTLALPSDAVICIHPWQVGYFQAYIPDDDIRPSLVLTPRDVLPRERQLWADDPAIMAADLDALLIEHGRLWLLDHRAMGRVLESKIVTYLAAHAYPVFSEWYGENTVLSFFATGEPVAQPVSARFGEWLALDGAALSPGPLEAGWGVVAVDLTWRLLERPGERYRVGLRLTDASGRVWAQRDSPPNGGLHHLFEWPADEPHLDRHGLLIPAGMPPGDYRVTLRVYRSQDVAVLPAVFEGGSGGEVTLGAVKVVRPETPPPAEALTIGTRLRAEFGDRLRLLGFSLDSGHALRPGEMVAVELFWQALADPGEDFLPRLQLCDPGGAGLAELTEKPVAGHYPTAWWRAGDLVRDPHALPIPATVPAGHYRLALSLVRAADGSPIGIEGRQAAVDLAEIEVQGREHQYWPTLLTHVQVARFGPSVELIGYDLREAVRAPGSPLEVTLHWHALQTPDKNYHAFVHLLDGSTELAQVAEGHIVAQDDGVPGEGELPTLGWLPGEYLTDAHLLHIPFDLADGDYHLGVGLYDPATGQRLGERLILNTSVPVQASGGCNCR